MIMVAFTHPSPNRQKDTCANIKATKQFSMNIIVRSVSLCCPNRRLTPYSLQSEPFIEAANYTSIDAPDSVSEWALTGLTQVKSTHIAPPRVGEAAFSMECELGQRIFSTTGRRC